MTADHGIPTTLNPTDALPLFGSMEDGLDLIRPERWTALKRRMLALYGDMVGRIPDEAAYELAVDILAARPRASELRTEGCLRATGQKRRARFGKGHELVITEKGLLVLQLLRAKSDAAA